MPKQKKVSSEESIREYKEVCAKRRAVVKELNDITIAIAKSRTVVGELKHLSAAFFPTPFIAKEKAQSGFGPSFIGKYKEILSTYAKGVLKIRKKLAEKEGHPFEDPLDFVLDAKRTLLSCTYSVMSNKFDRKEQPDVVTPRVVAGDVSSRFGDAAEVTCSSGSGEVDLQGGPSAATLPDFASSAVASLHDLPSGEVPVPLISDDTDRRRVHSQEVQKQAAALFFHATASASFAALPELIRREAPKIIEAPEIAILSPNGGFFKPDPDLSPSKPKVILKQSSGTLSTESAGCDNAANLQALCALVLEDERQAAEIAKGYVPKHK